MATDRDGPRISELLEGMEFEIEDLDWSNVEGYWIVAEYGGGVVGCLQVILGKPVGWLELMGLDQGLSHSRKAKTVKALTDRGALLLYGFGAQVVMGVIPDDLGSYKHVAERRGWKDTGHGSVMAKRIR